MKCKWLDQGSGVEGALPPSANISCLKPAAQDFSKPFSRLQPTPPSCSKHLRPGMSTWTWLFPWSLLHAYKPPGDGCSSDFHLLSSSSSSSLTSRSVSAAPVLLSATRSEGRVVLSPSQVLVWLLSLAVPLSFCPDPRLWPSDSLTLL